MESFMQLKNDSDSWNRLSRTIESYYEDQERCVSIFSAPLPKGDESLEFCFLVSRKHVVKYIIGLDRGDYLGVLQLGIGPHYFSPTDFWSYENSTRFTIEASTEGVLKNLRLLDEFLGYPVKPLFTP